MSSDKLIDELRDLGRTVNVPQPDVDVLAATVLHRITVDPGAGAIQRLKRRWRVVAAALAAVLLALALTPPVRAAVADWFGVVVRSGEPVEGEPVPGVRPDLPLAEARQHIDFDPVLPAELGTPDGIEVSDDERVLSMSWTTADGTVRVDEFQGAVEPAFVKRSQANFELVEVGPGVLAVWLPEPHTLLPLDAEGNEQVELARSVGPTLVWPVGEVSLRLEGLGRAAAVEIARATLGTD